MKRLLFIKTGYAIKGIPPELLDFEHWTAAAAGLTAEQCHTVTVIDGEQLPDVHDYRGIVISGSAAMVSDRHPWSEYTAQWLLDAMQHQVPILGICYGHQLLAHALGGVWITTRAGVKWAQKRSIWRRLLHRTNCSAVCRNVSWPTLPICKV